jgi:hypothetical protein
VSVCVCIGIRSEWGKFGTSNGDGNKAGVAIESTGSFAKRNFYIPCQSLLTAGFCPCVLSACRKEFTFHDEFYMT